MEKLKNISESIKKAITPDINWEKDERLNTLLVTFEGDAVASILEKISDIFENRIDPGSLKKASEQEKRLAESLFGITKGQYLFTSNVGGITLYGAWWPWGNGSKVSLRIGLFAMSEDLMTSEKAMEYLLEWFQV